MNKPFDPEWYLQRYPDVVEIGMDPLEHYELYGRAEGRSPGPDPFLIRNYRRIIVFLSLIPMAVKQVGGLRSAYRKTIALLKREGFVGLKSRLFHIARQLSRPVRRTPGFARNYYVQWIERYDMLSEPAASILRRNAAAFDSKPLISIVMPTYNANSAWLIEAIRSVQGQLYPNWELCIADDASDDPAIRPLLERLAAEDSRIRVVFRPDNGHISAASNSALESSLGDWVAFLDHDDVLPAHALYWVVDAINHYPESRLIYSDEDKIDENGNRFNPYFKCDWNIDLFYSHNLITHLAAYDAKLVKQVGGFRTGYEGAQDYDLALRIIELLEPAEIHHIPLILYHWRMHQDSTAKIADAKPYAMIAGEKALNEHFNRINVAANVVHAIHGYRVQYALPEKLPLVSLIIPTRNKVALLRQCIDSILAKTTYPNYEILLVDNGSDDPKTLDYFESVHGDTRVRVIHDPRPFNYSALNNAAVKLAGGELVALINNDIEVITPGWLSEMVSIALQPGVGVVGAKLIYPDQSLQHGGVILGIGGVAGHSHKKFHKDQDGYFGRMSIISGFSALTAACMIIRKSIYQSLGGFNDRELQVAFNDVDFCLRVKAAGYRNVWTPYAELFHHESASRGVEDTPKKRSRFAKEVQYMHKQWGDLLRNDPAYSPNLTLEYEDFSLAWPPRVELLGRAIAEVDAV